MVVFDTVYNPESTLLIRKPAQGLHGDDRRRYVHPPGRPAVQAFTGQESPSELLRDVLKKMTGPAKV